ncbi:MAG: hypothetical protein ACK4F7_10325 [Inhella sp.]
MKHRLALAPLTAVCAVASALFAAPVHAQTLIGGSKSGTTFPIQITQSGSYKLAGNLVVPPGATGITIANGLNVTIDLGGFELRGGNACSKAGCASNVITQGVRLGASQVRLINGSISGFYSGVTWGEGGIAHRVVMENLSLCRNMVGAQVIVLQGRNLLAEDNAFNGIMANRGVISDSVAVNNGGTGIGMGVGVVRDSWSSANGKYGFELLGAYSGLVSNLNAMGNSISGGSNLLN